MPWMLWSLFYLLTSQHCLSGRWCLDEYRPLHQRDNSPDIVDKVRDVSPILPKALGFFCPFQWGLSIAHLEMLSLFSVSFLYRAQFQFLLFYFSCHFLCPYSNYKWLLSPLLIQHFIIYSKNYSSFILKILPIPRGPSPCRQLLSNSLPARNLLIFIPNVLIQKLIPHLFSCQQHLLAWVGLLLP